MNGVTKDLHQKLVGPHEFLQFRIILNYSIARVPRRKFVGMIWERRKSLLIERPPPKYIILPQNKCRLAWDVILAIVLCVMAFYVPYRVCFYWNDDEEVSDYVYISTTSRLYLTLLLEIRLQEESDETSPVFVFEMFIGESLKQVHL
jgi:hypothetical protein